MDRFPLDWSIYNHANEANISIEIVKIGGATSIYTFIMFGLVLLPLKVKHVSLFFSIHFY